MMRKVFLAAMLSAVALVSNANPLDNDSGDAGKASDSNVLVFKNQMLGANQHPEVGCLLTVTDAGQLNVQTACYMKDDASLNDKENKKRRSEIDMIVNTYSGPSIALANSSKITYNLRNFKCSGSGLFKGADKNDSDRNEKDEKTANAEFPGYADIQTRFTVLQENVKKEKAIIDLVKSGHLEEISKTATPALFDGTTKMNRNWVQSIKPGESVSKTLFDVNSVVAFRSSKNGKIGLMLIRQINNLDGVTDAADATIVFDLYYQK